MFRPKLFDTLKNYNKQQFIADLVAGAIVGIVALPLAIAFAIASGVSPEKGLYTAIIAGFIISFLGGSRVQIGGPTGAFIVIVYGIVQQYGINGLIIATFIAGVILVFLGLARLGSIIKFIPHPLIVGFTSGIAVIIFSSQLKDFFDLKMGPVPADFIDKWLSYGQHFMSVNWYALVIGLLTVLIIIYFPKITRRIPGSLVALVLATLAVKLFHIPVDTIGSRFGKIPSSFPSPVFPHLNWIILKNLIRPAFTIAILGGIESLLSATVADGMIGGNHRSNMELVAQGAANIGSAIFGGIPATGAIARTATNVKSGGRTPVAGIVHAITLLIIMFIAGSWASLIPMSCLAGILVVVAYNMSEYQTFIHIAKGGRSDATVLVTTFLLTVFVDLTFALEAGMVMAVFFFMRKMIQISSANTKSLLV
jgi:SulP family sulfate permease